MSVKCRQFQNNLCLRTRLQTFSAPIDDLTVASYTALIFRKSHKNSSAQHWTEFVNYAKLSWMLFSFLPQAHHKGCKWQNVVYYLLCMSGNFLNAFGINVLKNMPKRIPLNAKIRTNSPQHHFTANCRCFNAQRVTCCALKQRVERYVKLTHSCTYSLNMSR